MKFEIEIGDKEKHQVSFYFNKFWGNLEIKVDGENRTKDFRIFSLSLTKSYEFPIGVNEKHIVRIDKVRPLILAGFRSNTYRVFVDNELLQEYTD